LWHGVLAYLQVCTARGVIHASVYCENLHIFWSMSAWTSPENMLAYRNSGNHRHAMALSRTLAAQVDFQHWQAETVPQWEAAMLQFNQLSDVPRFERRKSTGSFTPPDRRAARVHS
jgi:hypothetical protein